MPDCKYMIKENLKTDKLIVMYNKVTDTFLAVIPKSN